MSVTSQAAEALFDQILNSDGGFVAGQGALLKQEVGVISIGFNTVELMVVRDRKTDMQRTRGFQVGVRRLMEILDPEGHFTLGELDTRLRDGDLEIADAAQLWEREVKGVVDRYWKTAWKRFAAILLVGGGAVLLKNQLLIHFEGKALIPEQPVQSIARGLYKLSELQRRKAVGV